MATYHVGRLFDHVHLRAKDLEAAGRFYNALLEALEQPPGTSTPHSFFADELYISAIDANEKIPSTHVHLAFQARDEAMVKAFYDAALKAGGTDNGAPGPRNYHPGYYGAYVLDPDGNNIEAVFHGPSTRSAPSVVIEG